MCANDMCQDSIRRQECELCLFAQDEHHDLLYPFCTSYGISCSC